MSSFADSNQPENNSSVSQEISSDVPEVTQELNELSVSTESSHTSENEHDIDNSHSTSNIPFDSWGQIGHLTPSQQEVLDNFLKAVPEEHLEMNRFRSETKEGCSLRFLRARQFNLEKALALIKESFDMRTEKKSKHYANLSPDECLDCDYATLLKYYPHEMWGEDIFNRPILYEKVGTVNVPAMLQLSNMDKLLAYHWYHMEKVMNDRFDAINQRLKQTDSAAQCPISTCVILDLSGLTLAQCSGAVLDYMKIMIAIDNVCFPELLGKMIIINAPWIATTTFNLIKGWLDKRTQLKIEMVSEKDSLEKIKKYITEENMSTEFKGKYHVPHPQSKNITDYVSIPAKSVIKELVVLDPKKNIIVDTHTHEQEIEFEIYEVINSPDCTNELKHTKSSVYYYNPKKSHHYEVQSVADHDKFVSTFKDNLKVISKDTAQIHKGTSTRTKVEIQGDEDKMKSIIVFWKNPNSWHTRQLLYSIHSK